MINLAANPFYYINKYFLDMKYPLIEQPAWPAER